MTEPDAFEPTELERKLLDAAKSDRVPAELGLRIASALSTSTLAPAASAATKGSLLFSKAGLWGALTIAVLSGSGAFYIASSSPHAEALSRPVPIEAPAAPAPAAPVPAARAAAVPVPVRDPAAPPASASTVQALRAEIALLDRARTALDHGAPERATTLLDQHRRRFANGTLRPEAEALRIETLVRLGDTARAERLAQRFAAAYPAHPLSERVARSVPRAAPAPDRP